MSLKHYRAAATVALFAMRSTFGAVERHHPVQLLNMLEGESLVYFRKRRPAKNACRRRNNGRVPVDSPRETRPIPSLPLLQDMRRSSLCQRRSRVHGREVLCTGRLDAGRCRS